MLKAEVCLCAGHGSISEAVVSTREDAEWRGHQRFHRRAPGEADCQPALPMFRRSMERRLTSRDALLHRLFASFQPLSEIVRMQDATGNAADIAAAWAIGCGAPFAFGEHLKGLQAFAWH